MNLKTKNILDKDNLPEKIIPKSNKFKDISNQKFGYLTALYPCGYTESEHRLLWCCKCDCGNYVKVIGKNLRNGQTKSCGCYHKEQVVKENLRRGKSINIGDRFGRLVVLEKLGFEQHNGRQRSIYKCQCDCGNITTVAGVYLNYGDTLSCGCMKSKGETLIINFLQSHDINFIREYSFKDLLSENNNPLKFDFKINNFLIEYQGNIHFTFRNDSWYTEEYLKQTQERDQKKRNYCIEHNINLYEITYKDNLEEKLTEILIKEGF